MTADRAAQVAYLAQIDDARFWSYVRRGAPDECWPWVGGATNLGHGRFRIGRRLHLAHRLAFELMNGPIRGYADGGRPVVVRHACDNPRCCNPRHLLRGSQRENLKDMVERGRSKSLFGRTIPPEVIAAIQAETRPLAVVAADFGITINQAKWYRSRRGRRSTAAEGMRYGGTDSLGR